MDGTNRGLPGLPWRWPEGERSSQRAAPGLGADTDSVLAEVLELSDDEIATLRESDALT
jgi:crotonobetainyl-CoA:carnitine CoA-transferase CaiB-like acyl-CoA transferase